VRRLFTEAHAGRALGVVAVPVRERSRAVLMGQGVWFTSDLHIGHRLVAGHRGFADVEEHDAAILGWWNDNVGEEDHVWVLGDLAVSSPKRALFKMHGLPGIKHLVAGNHDACHPMHRDAHKHQRAYLDAFASVQPFARRRVNGTEILLSHFPYSTDRGEARYTQYRLRDEGAWLMHGHTHGTERVHGREIHVGLDAWGLQLVPLSCIAKMIETAA
jgi:calcineurin-like phosphoesterase family protein